jgi:hypothetical protein
MRNSSPKHATDGSAGATPLGVISSLEVYTLAEAKARLGWTDSALRAAKRRGLQLLACGKRRYVSGEEIVRFLKSLPTTAIN